MASAPRGFTLIELLIVVAIIGILAAIAVPNFLNAQIRAQVARVHADLKNLSTALESYHLDNNHYPGGPANWVGGTPFWQKHTYRFHPLTTPVSYISTIPLDPFQQPLPPNAATIWDGGYVYHDDGLNNQPHLYCDSCKYIVQSWGPDRSWESHGGAYAPDRWFQMSNGLRSLGDIVYAGPGGLFF